MKGISLSTAQVAKLLTEEVVTQKKPSVADQTQFTKNFFHSPNKTTIKEFNERPSTRERVVGVVADSQNSMSRDNISHTHSRSGTARRASE